MVAGWNFLLSPSFLSFFLSSFFFFFLFSFFPFHCQGTVTRDNSQRVARGGLLVHAKLAKNHELGCVGFLGTSARVLAKATLPCSMRSSSSLGGSVALTQGCSVALASAPSDSSGVKNVAPCDSGVSWEMSSSYKKGTTRCTFAIRRCPPPSSSPRISSVSNSLASLWLRTSLQGLRWKLQQSFARPYLTRRLRVKFLPTSPASRLVRQHSGFFRPALYFEKQVLCSTGHCILISSLIRAPHTPVHCYRARGAHLKRRNDSEVWINHGEIVTEDVCWRGPQGPRRYGRQIVTT